MRKIAHIINPVIVPPTSDLYVAQPITFESMRVARTHASGQVQVRLLSTQYREDRAIVPDGFEMTPDLDRSVLDVGVFRRPRKLPLIGDILDRLYETSEGTEYLIYTNVDIALMPHFYVAIDRMIQDRYDAIVINRRTISKKHKSIEELPLMYAEVGRKHRGYDCFVFRRDAYPLYRCGRVCVGIPWICRVMLLNLAARVTRFKVFEDSHLTFHIGADRSWRSPKFADYERHNRAEVLHAVNQLKCALGRLERIPAMRPFLEIRPHRMRPSRNRWVRRIRRAEGRLRRLLD